MKNKQNKKDNVLNIKIATVIFIFGFILVISGHKFWGFLSFIFGFFGYVGARGDQENYQENDQKKNQDKKQGKEIEDNRKKLPKLERFVLVIIALIFVFSLFAFPSAKDKKTKTKETSPTVEQAAEDTYLAKFFVINDFLTEEMNIISSITNKSYSLWTEEDYLGLALAMSMVKICYGDIEELSPPENFKRTYSFYKEGAKKYSDAMDYLAQGIDANDTNKILFASKLIKEGTVLINQAIASLE